MYIDLQKQAQRHSSHEGDIAGTLNLNCPACQEIVKPLTDRIDKLEEAVSALAFLFSK